MQHRYQKPLRKYKREIEIGRIWNILRFFPEENKENYICDYKKDRLAKKHFSANQLDQLVYEAKYACPLTALPKLRTKETIFKQYIELNGAH